MRRYQVKLFIRVPYSRAEKEQRTGDLITAVAAAIEVNIRANISDLAKAHVATYGTVSCIIHKSLGLVKKCARWIPKLLFQEQMVERVRYFTRFVKLMQDKSKTLEIRQRHYYYGQDGSVHAHTSDKKTIQAQ